MTTRPEKEESYLRIAEVIAERSTCARRKVGAVLVNHYHHIVGTGYNGVPRNTEHCTENTCGGHLHSSGQGLESCLAIHAEQNALMQCQNVMEIAKIYVTTSPCIHCMKMLMNTRCSEIYFRERYDQDALNLWKANGRLYFHVPRK